LAIYTPAISPSADMIGTDHENGISAISCTKPVVGNGDDSRAVCSSPTSGGNAKPSPNPSPKVKIPRTTGTERCGCKVVGVIVNRVHTLKTVKQTLCVVIAMSLYIRLSVLQAGCSDHADCRMSIRD